MAPISKDLLNLAESLDSPSSIEPDSKSGRAQPLSLEVPVGVQGSRRVSLVPGQPDRLEQFSEETSTVIVFPQGAVLRLSAPATQGQLLVVTNRRTHQAVLCKVVNIKSNPNVKGYVEVEFVQPSIGFWGVYFPQDAAKPSASTQPPSLTTTPSRKQQTPELPASASLTHSADKKSGPATAPTHGDFWRGGIPGETRSSPAPPVPPASVSQPLPVAPLADPIVPPSTPAAPAAPLTYSSPLAPPVPPTPAEPPIPTSALISSTEIPSSTNEARGVNLAAGVSASPSEFDSSAVHEDPWGRDEAIDVLSSVSSTDSEAVLAELKAQPHSDESSTPTSLAESVERVEPSAPPPVVEPIASIPEGFAPTGTPVVLNETSTTAPENEELAASLFSNTEVETLVSRLSEDAGAGPAATERRSSHAMVYAVVGALLLLAASAAAYFYVRKTPASASASTPVAAPIAAQPSEPTADEPPTNALVSPAEVETQPSTPEKQEIRPAPPLPKSTPRVVEPHPAPQETTPKLGWKPEAFTGKIAARAAQPASASGESIAPPDLGNSASAAAPSGEKAAEIQGLLPANSALPPPAAPSEPLRVGGKVKAPRLLSRVVPVYPSSARRIGLEGDVVVDAVIDPAGNVKTAKAISGPTLLRAAALDAVRQWKYEPSRLDDQPVSVQMSVTVQFRLH